MKKLNLALVLLILLASCGPAPAGESISACRTTLDGLSTLLIGYEFPHYFQTDNPVKQGGEFDVMQYFTVLDHLSMKTGYSLDYVYHYDGMGGYPFLYAHPTGQPPYAAETDLPPGTKGKDYLDYVQVDDSPEGYFQYTVLAMLGGQFYLSWHADYNDTQVVCDKRSVNDIVSHVGEGGFGLPMPLASRLRAAFLHDLEPAVFIGEQTVEVRMVTFTKWGGFYLTTYTLSLSAPHTILDIQKKNLIPYDCGIMF